MVPPEECFSALPAARAGSLCDALGDRPSLRTIARGPPSRLSSSGVTASGSADSPGARTGVSADVRCEGDAAEAAPSASGRAENGCVPRPAPKRSDCRPKLDRALGPVGPAPG